MISYGGVVGINSDAVWLVRWRCGWIAMGERAAVTWSMLLAGNRFGALIRLVVLRTACQHMNLPETKPIIIFSVQHPGAQYMQ